MYSWITLSQFLFLCGIVQGLAPYIPYKILHDSSTGFISTDLEDNSTELSVSCRERLPLNESFPVLNISMSIKFISLFQCILPPNSLIQEFQKLQLNISEIEVLVIQFNGLKEALPEGNYTYNLKKISTLSMSNAEGERDLFRNALNFLEPLSNINMMYISGLKLPPLPNAMPLTELTLADDASIYSWGNCVFLDELKIDRLKVGDIPEWPKNCSKLTSFSVSGLLPTILDSVLVNMQAAATNLRTLEITDSRIQNLPLKFLQAAEGLTSLDLSGNNLYDESFYQFPLFKSLETLILDENYLQGYVKPVLSKVPVLKVFKLSNNREFRRQCFRGDFISADMAFIQNTSIESLIFGATEVDLDCFENAHYTRMKYMDLTQTSSPTLNFSHLPTTDMDELRIELGSNEFAEINFNENTYESYRKKNESLKDGKTKHNKLIVNLVAILCDCLNGWLVRTLRDFPNLLSMPSTVCEKQYGTPLLEERPEVLECLRSDYGDCKYRKSWANNEVIVNCDRTSFYNETLPKLRTPLHGLNASGYVIDHIPSDLPETVKWVDLRGNRISRLDANSVAVLFKPGRRIWLGENLLDCDCDNWVLINAIHKHSDQVQDFANLTCVGSGTLISSVSVAVLCQETLKGLLGSAAVIAVLFVIAIVVWRRCGQKIRMYLYVRGFCLPCLRIKDTDDRPYDAFLSFAHGDEDYVREKLLPGLENAPEKFRICVHYRDWIIGEWIPTQIMRSVSLSKRTIILLSKNFVVSNWSALEFRFSVAKALQEGGSQVLILVLDDVLDLPLDAELRTYIAFNTYLRCDDPWFWNKLRYAMPHRKQKGERKEDTSKNENGHEMMDRHRNLGIVNENGVIEFSSSEIPNLMDPLANISEEV